MAVMIVHPLLHLPQNGRQRFRDGFLKHVPINLRESAGDHEGGDIRVKVIVMRQAYLA
jgi:hypothetical protein